MYGTIIFERPSRYSGSARKFKLLANGREIGRIDNGQEIRVQLPAGRYEIKAKLDFWSSAPLVVDIWPQQASRLVCRVTESGGFFGEMAAVFGIGHYLELFQFDPNYSYAAANPLKPFSWGTVAWQSALWTGALALLALLPPYLVDTSDMDADVAYQRGKLMARAMGQLVGFLWPIGLGLIIAAALKRRRT